MCFRIGINLLVSLLLCSPLAVQAMGLGTLHVLSHLDEPLEAEIELLLQDKEELKAIEVQLASEADYGKAGVERIAPLSQVQLSVNEVAGKPMLKLSSTAPMPEPFLNLIIDLKWPKGSLQRGYVLLLDPAAGGGSATEATPAPMEAAQAPQTPASTTPPSLATQFNHPLKVTLFGALLGLITVLGVVYSYLRKRKLKTKPKAVEVITQPMHVAPEPKPIVTPTRYMHLDTAILRKQLAEQYLSINDLKSAEELLHVILQEGAEEDKIWAKSQLTSIQTLNSKT